MVVRVGVFGTSWWADSMYLPALRSNPSAEVVAVCGRNAERATEFASRWDVPHALTDPARMLELELDAVVVATPNDTHSDLTMAAIEHGLHVLCEKPVATDPITAKKMADAAAVAGVVTLVPFTYRHMPSNRWFKELIDSGWIGRPHHLSLRYFTGFGLDPSYSWRFDPDVAGSGVLGDLGSHWLDMAIWLFGEIDELGATTTRLGERGPRPDGTPYRPGDDSALITVRFKTGASGILHVSSMCWEGDGFGQRHLFDAHGADGTLSAVNDWRRLQEVRGLKHSQPGPLARLPIPDRIWGAARRRQVHDTYRDIFRVEHRMIGDFIKAVEKGVPCGPGLSHGAHIQYLLDLAEVSAERGGTMLRVED